jgi:hypothetical protein
LGAANGVAWLCQNFDWDAYAKQAGAQKASAANDKEFKEVREYASDAESRSASNSLIPVQMTISQNTKENGGASVIFAVADFSFTSNGSVYSITQAKSDRLVGTKDGEWWASWQDATPTSAPSDGDAETSAALDTLARKDTEQLTRPSAFIGRRLQS